MAMIEIVVKPEYAYLGSFIESLPEDKFVCDEVLRDSRNRLCKVTVDNTTMVIKRFKKPNLFNRVVYSFFRKTKARRAYEYADRLFEMGIETAKPIAYIEIKKGGLFHTGYFVSEYLSHPLLSSIDEMEDSDLVYDLLKEFTEFTVDLHRKGVKHNDYNLTNVLYFKKEGDVRHRFALIDINRMRFRKELTRKQALKQLTALNMRLPRLVMVAEGYAQAKGWNTQIFCGRLLVKKGVDMKGRMKKPFKALGRCFKKKSSCS